MSSDASPCSPFSPFSPVSPGFPRCPTGPFRLCVLPVRFLRRVRVIPSLPLGQSRPLHQQLLSAPFLLFHQPVLLLLRLIYRLWALLQVLWGPVVLCAPGGHVFPSMPLGPCFPCGPWVPGGPGGPVSPLGPFGPAGPCWPIKPYVIAPLEKYTSMAFVFLIAIVVMSICPSDLYTWLLNTEWGG